MKKFCDANLSIVQRQFALGSSDEIDVVDGKCPCLVGGKCIARWALHGLDPACIDPSTTEGSELGFLSPEVQIQVIKARQKLKI